MRLSDFTLDAASGVRTLGETTSYRDGAEQYLLDGLAGVDDLSVGSTEVAALVKDWPSLYHLSPYRSTLFDCLGFDVVTLIGVLEYSHLYHPLHTEPRAAALANLRRAAQALGEHGALVLAIENRMGLKYLNGAREDHSGRDFEGIQGYPTSGSPVTWSLRELVAELRPYAEAVWR